MPDITLYNMKGKEVGALSLPDSIFGVEPNIGLIHQAVTTEEANQRQGTASTKTRANVRGGGRKPWRQKGTGRARQGSTRSPHWRHGGVVFGPHPRSYTKSFPRAMRQSAMRSALSARVADGGIIGIDALSIEGDTPSTKQAVAVFKTLPLTREVRTKHFEDNERVEGTREEQHRILVIVPDYDETLLKSVRNLPNVTLRYAPNFSVRDVVTAGRVLLAQGAVAKIEENLTRPNGAAAVAEPEVKPAKPKRAKAAVAEVEAAPAKPKRAKPAVAETEEAPVKPKRTRAAKAEVVEAPEASADVEEQPAAEATEEASTE